MQLKIILFAVAIIVGVKIASSDDFDTDEDGGDGRGGGRGGGGEGFKIIKECANEFSISGDDAKGVVTGNFSGITDNIQCFVKCVMIGNNVMDKEDNFNPEAVIAKFTKFFDREKVEQRTQKCEAVTGDSSCEKAFNIFKCLRERRKKQ